MSAMNHLKVDEREVEVVLLLDQVGPSQDALSQSYGEGPSPGPTFSHLYLVLLGRLETEPDITEHSKLHLRATKQTFI